MTSQPATPPPVLTPDRLFGPFDRELAHRTALPSPQTSESIVFAPAARDASPSYCAWPEALLPRS